MDNNRWLCTWNHWPIDVEGRKAIGFELTFEDKEENYPMARSFMEKTRLDSMQKFGNRGLESWQYRMF